MRLVHNFPIFTFDVAYFYIVNDVTYAAAVIVAKKEMWRRRAIWNRVQDFRDLTGIPVTSPIISLIVGSEATALKASRFPCLLSVCLSFCLSLYFNLFPKISFLLNRHLLEFGFHITAIRPPTVAPNSCRFVAFV